MFNKIKEIYLQRCDNLFFNVLIPIVCGVLIFGSRFLKDKRGFLIGIIGIIVIPIHAYLLKIAKDVKTNQLDYWKKKSINYSWLFVSIEKLIYRKTRAITKGITNPIEFNEESAWKNLQMLYEFYQHYLDEQALRFKIVFFVLSSNNNYLISKFWYNLERCQPQSYGNEKIQKTLFAKETSLTLAVRAWKSKKTEVAEKEGEISYNYEGQKETLKSIIACPIFIQKSANILGIITISVNKTFFFRRSDIETHKEYIEQFGIRIALEITSLNKLNKPLLSDN